jgi:hypothetical protein
MAEAHTARVLLHGTSCSSRSLFDLDDPPRRRSPLPPMLVAKPLALRTSYGEQVDKEYAADLRDKTKAPEVSATKTIFTSQGVEITGDYALALRTKFRRQAELANIPIPGSCQDNTRDMPSSPFMETSRQDQLDNVGGERIADVSRQSQEFSTSWVRPRGSVAEELSRSNTTNDICSRVAEVVCHSMAEDVEETDTVEWTNEATIADLLALTKKTIIIFT